VYWPADEGSIEEHLQFRKEASPAQMAADRHYAEAVEPYADLREAAMAQEQGARAPGARGAISSILKRH
jgi:hypothetical protein